MNLKGVRVSFPTQGFPPVNQSPKRDKFIGF